MSTQLTEHTIRGVPTVMLENDALRVSVLVGKGTDIYEFVHKPSGTNCLWQPKTGVRPSPYVADAPGDVASFMDLYEGGWQEIFPNGGDACTYKGAHLGFHGEACKILWDWQIEGDTLSCEVRLMSMPFYLQKRLWLDGATLHVWERVTNEGAEPLEFMWGHHPAFAAPFLSLDNNRLYVHATTVETHGADIGGKHQFLPLGVKCPFPLVPTQTSRPIDLRRLFRGDGRNADLCYLGGLHDSWYAVVNEDTKLGFALRWDKETFPYLWLWQECQGTRGYPWWGRYHVVGIEPHSSIPGSGLLKAIERGTAKSLDAGASIETELIATAFVATGAVQDVDANGAVRMRHP
jgi:hypothetical protein